ncbi:MAG: H-NS family nucleoid-associated regulatory protein [Lysobacteraceae bacterium]|jgi:DNA-binding protein H-NS|nr:H-NS histone family protein [Xanthomonadaceae bacterium]MCZ8319125.1 H-NS histone family protein [Silanimonas sp.]
MAVDLDGLSPKELDALISKAKQRKQTLAKRSSQAEVSKALAAVAKKHGWTLAELFGAAAPKAAKAGKPAAAPKARKSTTKGTKVAAKYRHPETGQTWSGRGILPKWMAEEIAKGKKREDFAI